MVNWGSYRSDLSYGMNVEVYLRDRCDDDLQWTSSCQDFKDHYDNWKSVKDVPINPCEASSLCQSLGDLAIGMGAGEEEGVVGICSFAPDTPVLMEDGKAEPIGKIKVGDKVQAANPKTGKRQGSRKVEHVWINLDHDLLDLTVRTKDGHTATLHTTANHPFWDDTTHTWVPAGKLHQGDALNTDSNSHVYVVTSTVTPGTANRWNLTVQQLHTYYVVAGGTPILVHNCNATVDELVEAGKAPGKNGFTRAGFELQKHGNRPGNNGQWPVPSGTRNPRAWSDVGQGVLEQILRDPRAAVQQYTNRAGDNIIEYSLPDRGVQFRQPGGIGDWVLHSFREN
jgi:hypothetical protein